MAKANPDAYKPDVAKTFNSLGKLLSDMDRMEEAEACLREALEIRRLLASKSPTTFEPYVAATCYDLGLFEIHRAKLDAAKLYFEEALSVYERFPHLAKKAQDCRDRLAELQA